MKLEQTGFINGNRNLLYPEIPFFLPSRAYRDPTVPITQYNGLCHVTLYHTYPLGVNHQVARTFQETRNWGLPSHINPPLARQNQKKRRPRLHTLLARVFTPCSLASSHLARPRLDTLLGRLCRDLWSADRRPRPHNYRWSPQMETMPNPCVRVCVSVSQVPTDQGTMGGCRTATGRG
jgi:hypothetical protein